MNSENTRSCTYFLHIKNEGFQGDRSHLVLEAKVGEDPLERSVFTCHMFVIMLAIMINFTKAPSPNFTSNIY